MKVFESTFVLSVSLSDNPCFFLPAPSLVSPHNTCVDSDYSPLSVVCVLSGSRVNMYTLHNNRGREIQEQQHSRDEVNDVGLSLLPGAL